MGKIIADDLAKEHKSISIAEFFEKNRHLLGFDSKLKAMLTCTKEAVDNSLDACEEYANLLKNRNKDFDLPDIMVRVDQLGQDTFKIIVEDNGPGIKRSIAGKVFAKLLYGSKFHRLKQGRGQQGIGISASGLYGQMTTGKPTRIISRTHKDRPAYIIELVLDIKTNEAKILRDEEYARFNKDTGTRVEITLEGSYRASGEKSIFEYLRRTSISNPHAKIVFIDPKGQRFTFKRATSTLPREPKEIKPHPWGLELGKLKRMLEDTKKNTVLTFLTDEFSKMGPGTSKKILEISKINVKRRPETITNDEAILLLKNMQKANLQRPPTDCLSPIGKGAIEKSLRVEFNPEYICATTRPPNVYRGYPFQIEASMAYGGDIPEGPARIMRVANKVPLLYESGACAITHAVTETDWKRYSINKNKGSVTPNAPLIVLVHICSVWVPFTSESKAAVANYPIILKEIKLALQDCLRQLKMFINKKMKAKREAQKINTFVKYGAILVNALSNLTHKDEIEIQELVEKTIEKKFGINVKEEQKKANEKKNFKKKEETKTITEEKKEGDK